MLARTRTSRSRTSLCETRVQRSDSLREDGRQRAPNALGFLLDRTGTAAAAAESLDGESES
jgi:hypothetical protein